MRIADLMHAVRTSGDCSTAEIAESAPVKMSRVRAPVAVAALATALCATPAMGLDLPFSQTAGFHAPTATLVTLIGQNPPVANRGGLEFFTDATVIPGPPLAPANPALTDVWHWIAWGCKLNFTNAVTQCANAGLVGYITGLAGDPSANPDRSSFKVQGQFGTIVENTWTDVTVVTHFNKIIGNQSNIVKVAEIHSNLRVGAAPIILDLPFSITTINYTETPNDHVCVVQPAVGAPVNPLGSDCDDFALVNGLDLSSISLPAGTVGNPVDYTVDFRLFAEPGAGALVCDGSATQPAACGGYTGADGVIIYTAENSLNTIKIQALLHVATPGDVPLFVVGDCQFRDTNLVQVGDVVNFWGAQWWKNNCMSFFVANGVASFKGYATNADNVCGGTWEARPGNSGHPPAVIPDPVTIIVTDTVNKVGPNISGTIKQLLVVDHDGKYGPAPGKRGGGPVTQVLCTAPPAGP